MTEKETKEGVKEKVKEKVKRAKTSAKNGGSWMKRNWKKALGVTIAIAAGAAGGYYYKK